MEIVRHVCNICGKDFDMWDEKAKFGFDYNVAHTSVDTRSHIRADFCIDCFEHVVRTLLPMCKISPIVEDNLHECDYCASNILIDAVFKHRFEDVV